VKTLTSGHGLLESPRWHEGRLWFADWTAGRILTVDDQGTCTTMVEHRSLPLCFDFLPDGDLVLVSGPEHAVLRLQSGRLVSYAGLDHLSPYGANDIVIDARGNTYVNNVNFDFASGPPARTVAPGFIALVTPDGQARVVADGLAFPNGMAVTDDGATLVVAESYRQRLTAYDIHRDGTLSSPRTWADLGDHAPDGIAADADGAVWYADVPHQLCARVAEGGKQLDRVGLDRGGFACALGGPESDPTLFVVAAKWPGAENLMTHTDWDGTVFAVPAPSGRAR
jgi:sugar lactone lactonase YvrE